jgi:hypothetical protein
VPGKIHELFGRHREALARLADADLLTAAEIVVSVLRQHWAGIDTSVLLFFSAKLVVRFGFLQKKEIPSKLYMSNTPLQ